MPVPKTDQATRLQTTGPAKANRKGLSGGDRAFCAPELMSARIYNHKLVTLLLLPTTKGARRQRLNRLRLLTELAVVVANSGIQRAALAPSCQVAEHCWDPVGLTTREYVNRFERLSRAKPGRR